MDGAQINLKCSNFLKNVFSSFNALQGSDLYTDVTLVSDDSKKIQAHKLILSAGSEYFRNILSDRSHPHPMLCLDGVSFEDLEWILKYLYVGEVSVPQSSLQKFLKIANKFKCFGLKEGSQIENSEDNNGQGSEMENAEVKYVDNVISKSKRNDEKEVLDSVDDHEEFFVTKYKNDADNIQESDIEITELKYIENEEVLGFGNDVEESSSAEYKIADICDEGASEEVELFYEKDGKPVHLIAEQETETVESLPDLSREENQIEKKKCKPLFEFCRIDGEIVSKDYLYKKLKDLYQKKDQYLYQCNHCERSSNHVSHMMEHVQGHLKNFEFDCQKCGKVLTSLRAIRNHKASRSNQHPERSFPKLAQSDEKVIHLSTEQELYEFSNKIKEKEKMVLNEENRNFKSDGELTVDEDSPSRNVNVRQIVEPQTLEPSTVKVTKLINRTPNKSKKTNEQITSPTTEPQLTTTEVKRLSKPTSLPALKSNEISTELSSLPQSNVCETCNKHFKTKRNAQVHYQTIHLGMRFPCNYCHHMATSKTSRRLHIESQHLNEKEQCSYCGKQISKNYIKIHIEEMHENSLKTHKCSECSFETKKKHSLKEHFEFYHLKIVKNMCSQCDYTALKPDHLKQHEKRMHP